MKTTLLAISAAALLTAAQPVSAANYIPTRPQRVLVPKDTPVCPTGHDAMVSLGEGRIVPPCVPAPVDTFALMQGVDRDTNSVWVDMGGGVACDRPSCPYMKGYVFAGNAHETNQRFINDPRVTGDQWEYYRRYCSDPLFPRGFAGQPPLECQ